MVEVVHDKYVRYDIINILNININDFKYFNIGDMSTFINNRATPTYTFDQYIKNPNLFKKYDIHKMLNIEDYFNKTSYFIIIEENKMLNINIDIYYNSKYYDVLMCFLNKYKMDIRNKKMNMLIEWLK